MLSYCLKCKTDTESKYQKVPKVIDFYYKTHILFKL